MFELDYMISCFFNRSVTMKKALILLTSLLFFSSIYGQQNFPWTDIDENSTNLTVTERANLPQMYRTIQLDLALMNKILRSAPGFQDAVSGKAGVSLAFPMPDGTTQNFQIFEKSVMHPDLAAKYPAIKSYVGYGVDDPTANARFGISPKGFHAMIMSGRTSSVYIDTYDGDATQYVSFFRKDKNGNSHFSCGTETEEVILSKADVATLAAKSGDCQIREYRLALACTGEYAQFHGGTVADVMAEYVRAMARVNGIYERDFSVTMTMVPNTDELIFLNSNTDPYTNNNGGRMLSQNQTTCDNIIGNANYDIGHVFSTGGGGIASLRSVCDNSEKAEGVTGLPQPTGDPFWVEYVCHEMGHQFGGNHTQNTSCNRVAATAVEPGSGSSIMSYIGICDPNVGNAGEGDPYFHARTMIEIYSFIQAGGDCASKTDNGNSIPTVTARYAARTLPVSTPFCLTGTANDPDGNGSLTYTWDQMDNEIATMPPVSTNSGGPAFRFISADDTPERYFPNIDAIVKGQTPTWEVLPSVSREMNFRFVVRDNSPGNGCVSEDDVELTFNQNAGPFLVESPNGSESWFVGETKTVEWDVANTITAPVNCQNVDIFLSKDGGYTYPVLLAQNVPNVGSYDIMVPSEVTTTGRVMVRAADNYFFDISNNDFVIELPPEPTFVFKVSEREQTVCSDDVAIYSISLESLVGFNEMVTMSVSGVPAGADATFQPATFQPTGGTTLNISNLSGVPAGTYALTVTGNSASKVISTDLTLNVFSGKPAQPALTFPADGEEGIPTDVTLTWATDINASQYLIEVATSPSFGTSIVSTGTIDQSEALISGLENARVYFWRVVPNNICGTGTGSEIYAFRTFAPSCQAPKAATLPVDIPAPNPGDYTSEIEITDDFSIISIRVLTEFEHSYIGDLYAELVSPGGTTVRLFDRPGIPASQFGCGEDNIQVVFDDKAMATATEFDNRCSSDNPAIAGDFQPLESLSILEGTNAKGTWTLRFGDGAAEDGGSLTNFQIELCQAVTPPDQPNSINNQLLTVNENSSKNIDPINLETVSTNNTPSEMLYLLRRTTSQGDLLLNGSVLSAGSNFTQEDINSGNITYRHTGMAGITTDDFLFDVFNSAGGWLSAQVFNINILVNTLSISSNVNSQIACFGNNNGQITVNGSGGTAPFEYRLNNGTFQSSNIFTQLIPGDYTPTIRDANGFTRTGSILTITQPTEIIASASVNDDDITVTASGGTGTLQYSIDGANFQMSNTFADRANGAYTIMVRDENGCTKTTSAIVAVNTLLTTIEILNNITCAGDNDGRVQVNVAGGEAPYQYSLNSGAFQMSNIFENLAPGNYSASVKDAQGFEQTTSTVTITSPVAITLNLTTNGDQVTANASGGTGTLRYEIDGAGFQTNNVFTGVTNGMHTIIVRDENGCVASESVTIAVNRITISSRIIRDLLCFGVNEGIIEATADGGVEPYTYSLNGGAFESNNRFENLATGCYTVVVRDAEGFEKTAAQICLNNPTEISASTSTDGYDITVNASGGNPPYEYSLDGTNWQLSNVFLGNASGIYDAMLVRDANGCTRGTAGVVSVPTLELTGTQTATISCFGDSGAEITLMASGGFGPFGYSSGGDFQASNVFSGLSAGSYTFTVKDAGGVTTTFDITIDQPARLNINLPTYSDQDMMISASGGTPDYEFNFDGGGFAPGNILADVTPGQSYQVLVRDANGCVSTGDFTVPQVILNGLSITQDCSGGDAASVSTTVTGGVAPIELSLDGGNTYQSDNTFENLAAGTYELFVRDAGGFIYNFPVGIVDVYPLMPTAAVTNADVTASTINGLPPYEYSLDGMNFDSNNEFTDLANGSYTLTVRDANGCTSSTDFIIDVVGVNDLIFDLNFEINPNPSNGILNLKMPEVNENQIFVRIFDATGKLVFDKKIEALRGDFEEQIDVQHLQAGSYLVTVLDGQKIGRKQVVILK